MPNEPDNSIDPQPCGGKGQKPCPPQPALDKMPDGQWPAYSYEDMLAYGEMCYQKRLSDER